MPGTPAAAVRNPRSRRWRALTPGQRRARDDTDAYPLAVDLFGQVTTVLSRQALCELAPVDASAMVRQRWTRSGPHPGDWGLLDSSKDERGGRTLCFNTHEGAYIAVCDE